MPPDAPAAEDASDAELLRRVRGGAPAALQPLYERYGGPVYRFALLWSGSPAIAADVTQDAFVHLLSHAADFDPARGHLSAYLCGIARNFVRRTHALPAHDPLPDEDADDAVPPAPRGRGASGAAAAPSRERARPARHRAPAASLSRGDPLAELFEVPADYKVREERPPHAR